MFRFCLAAVAGLLLTARAPAANWAEAMFDDLARDFGTVARGQMLTHPYRLTNNTGQTVRIISVRVSCGCTSATALAGVIAPGQSTSVLAQMDTRRFVGPKTVTIYVQLDQPQWAEVRLSISANARDDISVTPDTLAFGSVPRGNAATRQTTVSFNSGQQLVSVAAESNYVQLQARAVGSPTGYGHAYEVTATLRPDTPVGKWFTDVWLNTNDPSSPRIRVPLTVDVEPALSLSPNAVTLGQAAVGKTVVKRIIIRGGQPFHIKSIEGTDETVQVETQPGEDAKPAHVLTVKVTPAAAGEINRTLKIITDLPGDSTAELSVKGTAPMPHSD